MVLSVIIHWFNCPTNPLVLLGSRLLNHWCPCSFRLLWMVRLKGVIMAIVVWSLQHWQMWLWVTSFVDRKCLWRPFLGQWRGHLSSNCVIPAIRRHHFLLHEFLSFRNNFGCWCCWTGLVFPLRKQCGSVGFRVLAQVLLKTGMQSYSPTPYSASLFCTDHHGMILLNGWSTSYSN